jgi:GntR family transcriptional regulator, arabinose operon transcriptional repressor
MGQGYDRLRSIAESCYNRFAQGMNAQASKPKYRRLFDSLKADIVSGRFQPGQKLPSEAALVHRTGSSRITVGRAMRELQEAGLIERVAGSGSYVRRSLEDSGKPHLFGLLIPDLGETEIFEPICQAIANAPEASEHALLWGHADARAPKAEQAWQLCRHYIFRRVSGVFFAPLEFEQDSEKANRRILSALGQAQIAVVLLDRHASKAPERRRPDLVGLNNRQAGYAATEHLVHQGCERIAFLGYHGSASTLRERMAGYREALAAHGLRPVTEAVVQLDPGKERISWKAPAARKQPVEAFVCVNDRMAGMLMQLFLARKIRIPEDMRIVGIDDASYASLLPVPLTTIRQPLGEIGQAALRMMIERIRMPHSPPREILFDGELVVRRSCGADAPPHK